MSPKAFVRTGLALAALIAAACSEPLAPRLERINAQLVNALNCTIEWTNPVNGDWNNAAMWTPARIPLSTDNVCIIEEGNYMVQLIGVYVVNSVTIGVPGNVDKPKLTLTGYNLGAGWSSSYGRLIVANGVENYGYLHLAAYGPFALPGELISNGGVIHNHDIAEIRSIVGTAGGRSITGTLINDGTLAFDLNTTLAGNFTNNALFSVAPGVTVNHQGTTPVFTQASGTMALGTGVYLQQSGTFNLNGGEITGNTPVLTTAALKIGGGEIAKGTVVVRGASTLTGNIGKDQVVQIEGYQLAAGWPESWAELKSATGFVNKGTLRLTSGGSGPMSGRATMTVQSGTLVNEGRIETLPGTGNSRVFVGSIDNTGAGVIDLQTAATFSGTNPTITNAGTFKATGAVTAAGGMTWIQNAGTMQVPAGYNNGNGGAFHLNGGVITGEPFLTSAQIRIGAGSTATGSVAATGTNTLTGDVQPGQKITVGAYQLAAGWSQVAGVLNIPASITNRGTIVATTYGGPDPGTTSINAQTGATLTNAPEGRIEFIPGSTGHGKFLTGNVVNEGTIHVAMTTHFQNGTLRTTGPFTGGGEFRNWYGATTFATGTMNVNFASTGTIHVGQAIGDAGQLTIGGSFVMYGGTLFVNIGGTVPGADFDRMTVGTNGVGLAGVLNVTKTSGTCVPGGASYEFMSFPGGRSGDFGVKQLAIGEGRTVTAVPGATNYLLNVSGPACDNTAPLIAPTVTGAMGDNGWYRSDVTVTWSVTDAESPVTSSTGCEANSVTSDNAGLTFTCSATSAGGTATETVTIKRDATPPAMTFSRTVEPNTALWFRTPVTVTFTGADAMSGLVGDAVVPTTISTEGIHEIDHVFRDLAGNTRPAATVVRLDMTAPTVVVTRSPAPDATGWNDTDVTATWTATDALSGFNEVPTATHVFDTDGAGQSATRSFTDRAGNSASATISNVNIDKTPAPPPPPPPLTAVCSVTPNEIWPANNKLIRVQATIGGAGVTSFTLRSITNNESGTADVDGWTIGAADADGYVLAKRSGGGTGRTYTLTYDVFGAGGATGSCAVTVRVPHDQRR